MLNKMHFRKTKTKSMIENRLSLDGSKFTPSKGYFKKMIVKKTSFDPKKLLKTPCMYHKADGLSDALMIYFHANAEDINLSSFLCEYLKRNLKVSPKKPSYFSPIISH